MPRYKHTKDSWLLEQLAALTDDLTRPWNEYPCLEWPFVRNPDGYGYAFLGGRQRIVSRYAYEVAIGPLPKELHACHRCDNPPCFRPIHMFPGTTLDNIHDMIAKGRKVSRGCPGETNWCVKLTDEKVTELRRRHQAGEGLASLSEYFKISKNHVWKITSGQKWKHLL
jgi:HNH endonuclease